LEIFGRALAREAGERFQSARDGVAISELLAKEYRSFSDYDLQSFLDGRKHLLPSHSFEAFADEPAATQVEPPVVAPRAHG
jgi:hypothetical protein